LSISPAEVVPFADIGDVGAPGSADFDGTTFIVRGSGADIWSTADAFGWTSGRFEGSFDVIAQVTSITDVHQWTKAGLMIRANSSPSAPHVSLFVTPANGIAFQRRLASGGATTHTAGPMVTAPVWLKLSRRGDTVYAAYRVSRTDPWTLLGSDRSASIASPLLVGLVVTSHAHGTIATATFDQVDVVPLRFASFTNIGDVGIPGKVETDAIATRITASGHDIWGTADAFTYQLSHWTGDGVVTARVLSFDAAHPWAKAGVMFRQSLDADAPHAMVIVSAQQGVSLQYRDVGGGRSFQAGNVAGAAPAWVRLTRRGDMFIGQMSVDGAAWTTIGSITLPMTFDSFVGLAVSSHDNAASATATFDDVAIEEE
jgi:regulation of enolase protein 1 (concanavalin A-like superfamily)